MFFGLKLMVSQRLYILFILVILFLIIVYLMEGNLKNATKLFFFIILFLGHLAYIL